MASRPPAITAEPTAASVVAAGLACALAGCGAGTAQTPPTPVPVAAPLVVQVENSEASRPQSGLSSATIIYEYVAEGGVGRFSAIYAQPQPTRVGPIRSARLVTLSLLQLYRGVLVYSGADQYIQGLLASSGLPHYDENNAAGGVFRIAGRYPPHNLYSDQAHLTDLLRRAAAPPVPYRFFSRIAAAGHGLAVSSFTVPISDSERPTWTWDATRDGWTRSEADTGSFTDAVGGQPLLATTVIVQQVKITTAPQVVDVNGVHGVAHELTGTGQAQVFVGGQEFDARWFQPSRGPPRLTLADGRPAPIAPGSIWFELVAVGSPAATSPAPAKQP
jgi:hypothetical protein